MCKSKKEENIRARTIVRANRLRSNSPPGGTTAYQLLNRSINRQVAKKISKNDALALSPTFRYVPIESPL
ncbi:hypothetical protein TNCV_3108721 [Trichonephila clavipes]|uniref:Uncharacterized protein n=1 Tax=Trichonephila clavipes TaxID=2585209 RepID=A0A8X6S7G3_TRICX|nr:hypothetical protein TNCV_3108721 [Trichonephila clavipes]